MKNFIFSASFLLTCLTIAINAQCTSYTLQNGQTMSSISNGNFNLFAALVSANPAINFSVATTGTIICIPTATYSQYNLVQISSCTSYTVKPCDSFSGYNIKQKFMLENI